MNLIIRLARNKYFVVFFLFVIWMAFFDPRDWGLIWTRPGLPRKIRSLVNIAMISTLNRPHELKIHVKGAIRNGLSKEEIREVLFQVAIYAGVPAGVDSFRIAKEALTEMGV